MILILLCVFLNECEGSDYRFNDNLSSYQNFMDGPYWTYPVRRSTVVHSPDYFSVHHLTNVHSRLRRSVISHEGESSDHEFPRDVPTKPNHDNKGLWAKGKIPGSEVDLGFVPLQVYSQVRRYDTVKHLPRSAALDEASTAEEAAAAPRLREVLSHKKISQVYEEEGYEDSGYDHGGYNHHGAKYEDHDKNDELDSQHSEDPQIRSAEGVGVYAQPAESSTTADPPLVASFKNQITESIQKSTSYGEGGDSAVLLEESAPKVEDSEGEFLLVDGEKIPIYKNTIQGSQNNKTTLIYYPDASGEKSREKLEESRESIEMIETAESRSGTADEAEVRVVNDPRPKGSNSVTFPGRHTRRQYALGRPTQNWTPMAPADVFVQESVGYNVRRPYYPGVVAHNVHHYLPYTMPFPNYYSDNPASYASPVPQILKFPIKTTKAPSVIPQISSVDTLNAYTSIVSHNQTTPPPVLDMTLNKTDYIDLIQPRFNNSIDLQRSNTRVGHQRNREYNNFTRANKPQQEITSQPSWTFIHPLLNTRHPSLPRDGKEHHSEIQKAYAGALVATRPEVKDTEIGPVKYIEQLTVAHYSTPGNNPIKASPQNYTGRLIELAKELNAKVDRRTRKKREAMTIRYDSEKYPFYQRVVGRNKGNRDSALKYATNPATIPKKTPGGMEFYESRDKLVRCDEPSAPDDVIPERDEDGEWNKKPQPDVPRLKGLGDSIQCMKTKYFGKEPLDNPFFQEDVIDTPKYEPDDDIENQKPKFHKKRKGESTKRLMVLPTKDNSTKPYAHPNQRNYSNHKMTHDTVNNTVVFPYKNHKPEAESSPSSYDLRITNPYSYQGYGNPNNHYYSIYENPDEGDLINTESSKKHHHYRPYQPQKHKNVPKKKRYRPYQQPVSIYSIISHNGYPNYVRPLVYAHSVKTHKVIPVYPIGTSTPQSIDNIASDTQANPTKFYIIRPGEYTENKDLVADKKESTSIWSYMNPLNPLKWWFPSLFDNRRKEPRYRKRRNTDYIPYDKVISKDNRKADENVEVMSGEHSVNLEIPANHKPETTIGPPITLAEYKSKLNITSKQQRLNRLTGGFISRNNVPNIGAKLPDLTPYVVLTTLPPATEPTTRSLEAPTLKPKVLFPRTKLPKRKPLLYRTSTNSEVKNVQYTTTTTTEAPTTIVTRMYKPKRIINKNFNSKMPINAFSVLRKPKPTIEYPFESKESGETSEENPRRLQQVEHRRVTKEETYKTTFIPEEEAATNQESTQSGEDIQYSVSSSDTHPVTEKSGEKDTLTYLVNPETGVGTWGEQPGKRTWKPKKKPNKRQGSESYRSTYAYPTTERRYGKKPTTETPQTKRSAKKPRDLPQYDSEAYIVGLMSKIPPPDIRYYHRIRNQPRASPVVREDPVESEESTEEYSSVEEATTPVYVPPTKKATQFILEPDKRKYYYVKD